MKFSEISELIRCELDGGRGSCCAIIGENRWRRVVVWGSGGGFVSSDEITGRVQGRSSIVEVDSSCREIRVGKWRRSNVFGGHGGSRGSWIVNGLHNLSGVKRKCLLGINLKSKRASKCTARVIAKPAQRILPIERPCSRGG